MSKNVLTVSEQKIVTAVIKEIKNNNKPFSFKNGAGLSNWLKLVIIGVGIILGSMLAKALLSSGVQKIVYASEQMPFVEKSVEENTARLDEMDEVLRRIELKVDDLWRQGVPRYHRESTELRLRGDTNECSDTLANLD
jgi:hypothetical protein